jgi:Xaa-Pro aminopeptidase
MNLKEEIETIRRAAKKACRSKRAALAFLYKHGFTDKNGKLKKEYETICIM